MSWQRFPPPPQTSHWYWKLIGVEPFHVPGFAVSVLPTVVLPLIVGFELLDGAASAFAVTADAVEATTSPATAATSGARRYHFMSRPPLGVCLNGEFPADPPRETELYRPRTVAYGSLTDGKPCVRSTWPSSRTVIASYRP